MSGWWLPLYHRRLWFALSCALIGAVIVGSLTPGGVPKIGHLGDKWEHALSYLVLATWFVGLHDGSAAVRAHVRSHGGCT